MARCGGLVGSLDAGTSSVRFSVYRSDGTVVAQHHIPLERIYPQPGWVEQDPTHILEAARQSIELCVAKLLEGGQFSLDDIKAIGVTNQRETAVVWDRVTGAPLYNAVVWYDMRTAATVSRLIHGTPTDDKNYLQKLCGLPLSTYFSAVKLRWLLDNVPAVREEAAQRRCMFGTMDSWLLWNLTGGTSGGVFVTDVTNASRTMLLNIHTLAWDPQLCKFFNIPMEILPTVKSSAEVYGQMASGPLAGKVISGCLGDQHAALLGQLCLEKGQAKNTYGTGCFLVYNTGLKPIFSRSGLLTTVAFKLGPNENCVYALEGAVATAGSAVQWLRDELGIIDSAPEVETLARQVETTNGVYFVPAFSGLLAPHWNTTARGTIVGLSAGSNRCHLARATLEAVCFQTREVLEAMNKDCNIPLTTLNVDGGMTGNDLLMQLQADLLGIPVARPDNAEITSFGAAIAAGVAIGVWDLEDVRQSSSLSTFKPRNDADDRDQRYGMWRKAVRRSLGWVATDQDPEASDWPKPVEVDVHARSRVGGAVGGIVGFGLLLTGLIFLRHHMLQKG